MLLITVFSIFLWSTLTMPAYAVNLLFARDVRYAAPWSLLVGLQGLEFIGLDYKIPYLDSVFTAPVWYVRTKTEELRVLLEPTALKLYLQACRLAYSLYQHACKICSWIYNKCIAPACRVACSVYQQACRLAYFLHQGACRMCRWMYQKCIAPVYEHACRVLQHVGRKGKQSAAFLWRQLCWLFGLLEVYSRPVRAVLRRCALFLWGKIGSPFFNKYWKVPTSAGAMAGSLAFFWSFARACDELMSNSAMAKYSVNQTVTFLMAGVALLSLSANILGSIGEGRPGSFWEKVRLSGIRISGLLDLGVFNLLAAVVPRIFFALFWCVKQVSWVMSAVLAAVGKLTDICRRALERLLASALASLSSLVWFIWAHSALNFAASCAFLFLVYKVNNGDWVVCDASTRSRSVRAAESVGALIERAAAFITTELPAVAAQAQSMWCAALQPLLQALTPVTASAALGIRRLGDEVCDSKVPLEALFRSPSAALGIWFAVGFLGQAPSVSAHSTGVGVTMLVMLTLLHFARNLLVYGACGSVCYLVVCLNVRSGERVCL
jgi:hypothetical protein